MVKHVLAMHRLGVRFPSLAPVVDKGAAYVVPIILYRLVLGLFAVVAEWQTRCLQAAVSNDVWVQIPSTAPF